MERKEEKRIKETIQLLGIQAQNKAYPINQIIYPSHRQESSVSANKTTSNPMQVRYPLKKAPCHPHSRLQYHTQRTATPSKPNQTTHPTPFLPPNHNTPLILNPTKTLIPNQRSPLQTRPRQLLMRPHPVARLEADHMGDVEVATTRKHGQ